MSEMPNFYALLLAGGAGTRLWPLSRDSSPKQLMVLNGEESLLQQAARRVLQTVPPHRVMTVTKRELIPEVERQLSQINPALSEWILGEPVGRNTLPAIAWGVTTIAQRNRDAIVGVFPADQLVRTDQDFEESFREACAAAREGNIVTFGIKPREAATGFGYIRSGARLNGGPACSIEAFVEKPQREVAEQYLKAGNYYWNSGMFIFPINTFSTELNRLQPTIAEGIDEYVKLLTTGNTMQEADEIYARIPNLSIDYGIMENTNRAAVIPAGLQWNDVGSWDAYYSVREKDEEGNVLQGDVVSLDTKGSLLLAQQGVLACIGLENMAVIQTGDAVLISPRDRVQDVKKIVDRLKEQNCDIVRSHATVTRPWGQYTVLEQGLGYKIKRIVVDPGHHLSLQEHKHRAEHWVVISGRALVANGNREFELAANESTFIPCGHKHRLSNPGQEPLHIIEVQTGSYVGEDDIVRYEDRYGRR